MPISDLTNTKWVLNNTITSRISSSSLTGDIDYDINFTCNNNSYRIFNFVKNEDEQDYHELCYYPTDYTTRAISVYDFQNNTWYNQSYRIIEITGGVDATNAILIAWLEANATQVPVTDLSGTEWEFNASIDFEQVEQDLNYYINFSFLFKEQQLTIYFDRMRLQTVYVPDLDTSLAYWSFTIGYYNSEDSSYNLPGAYYRKIGDDDTNRWMPIDDVKTITISSGTDTTNPDLIVWLTNNATLQEEPTVTVPASFADVSLTEGSGYIILNINGVDFNIETSATNNIPTLISFTIGNTTYQAEQEMTWSDFINSNYNTSNIQYDSSSDYIVIGNEGLGTYETGSPAIGIYVQDAIYYVTLSDTIIENENYTTTIYMPSGGSND